MVDFGRKGPNVRKCASILQEQPDSNHLLTMDNIQQIADDVQKGL